MNSASELTGNAGGTASTVGEFAISVIGSRSSCGAKPELLVERWIGREADAYDQQRVAVGLGAHHREGADIGIGAGTVDDDERLTEAFRKAVADKACKELGPAAGGERHHHLDRPCG